MSVNDALEDAFIRHQIFLQRYVSGREREAQRYIKRLLDGIIAQLAGNDITVFGQARLAKQISDLQLYMTALNDNYQTKLIKEMIDFSSYEAEFNYNVLRQNITNYTDFALPSPAQLESAIFTEVMDLEANKGYTISTALREFSTKKQTQIIQVIRDGIALGTPIAGITQSITGLSALQGRQASTLARTIVNMIATITRTTTMRANRKITNSYKWVATLDGFTSVICMGLDGKVFKDIDSNPKPPAHFNCRSTITYVVNPKYDLGKKVKGTRPSVGADDKAKSVSDKTTYARWLRTQPRSFQNEVLGVGRANIFREGKLPLDKFVDMNGRELNLQQLRELEQLYTSANAGF